MLIGIPDIIGSDRLKALADTGHGDLIVIADHFYPPYSKSPHAVSIQAKGTGSAEMLDAVLQLVPLDTEYEKQPIWYIVPDQESGVIVENNPVWDDVKETVAKHGYDPACIGTLERMKFYEKAGMASVTICTSETQPYGCIMLQKGVK
ncbi:MAG: RbsD/FucU family protein [Oscillospiraceae bacterium]|nr:RbsD/FucU family protein [Oscillospiraceae bacterium]